VQNSAQLQELIAAGKGGRKRNRNEDVPARCTRCRAQQPGEVPVSPPRSSSKRARSGSQLTPNRAQRPRIPPQTGVHFPHFSPALEAEQAGMQPPSTQSGHGRATTSVT
jgi:hypothetical protein